MTEEDKTTVPLTEGLTPQEFMRRYYKFPHLSKEDARIEWLAWLLMVGLFVTAILETGCAHQNLF